ncbi:MAG: apolipoprotein N-acyltransferase [Deltaproteobacteria bacterium]|nr:apolipoprotein N-acyltransferase [Deltaproteobacteria bacterium]
MLLQYREKLLLAVLSGFMLTASFPPGHLSLVAWVAFIPLLRSLEGLSGKQALTSGFCFGLAHNLSLVYWVVFVMQHYGNLPIAASVAILLLLAMYLALYPAVFSLLLHYPSGSFSSFKLAGLWVFLEFVRANVLTGFPWCLVGHSQYLALPFIQIADLVGVYGISFLVLFFNAVLYRLLFHRPQKVFLPELAGAILMLGLTLAYGYHRLLETPEQRGSLKVTIVQGNIDQSIKWHPSYQAETVKIYGILSLSSNPFAPDIVIWPETAAPLFFQDGEEPALRILENIRQSGAYFIFGSPAYAKHGDSTFYYNRAYLVSPAGKVMDAYDKVHLVPFGEYVPLKRYLPFIDRLVISAGDFKPGEKLVPMSIPKARIGVLICYESIFPELARAMTRNGADILVNLTNDAWYGMTSAPYQHFSMAVFRAVENRRPLVRAANTGFSAFINTRGKITQITDLFSEAVLNREQVLEKTRMTVYTRYGDFFPLCLAGLSLLQAGFFLYHKR